MKKFSKQIELKNKERFFVSTEQWALIERALTDIQKGESRNQIITVGGITFDVADIKFAKTVAEDIYNAYEEKDLVSEEKRNENIERLIAYKSAAFGTTDKQFRSFNQRQKSWYAEMKRLIKEGIYPDSDWRNKAGIVKAEWDQARKVFFEVNFDDRDHENNTLKTYIFRYIRGNQDPRSFDMYHMVSECRSKTVGELAEVFGV